MARLPCTILLHRIVKRYQLYLLCVDSHIYKDSIK